MINITWLVLIAVTSYVLGSIPTAYFVTKGMIGTDVKQAGSHNVGAMNTFRLIQTQKGTRIGIAGFGLVLLGDIGKGALAVFLAQWLSFLNYDLQLAIIIASFFVVLGHNYSVFLKFKRGGRGLATLGGVIMGLSPPTFLLGLATLLFVIFVFQYLLVGKMNWRKFSDVFSVVGSQIVGRVAGLVAVLAVILLVNPNIFFPTLAAMVLVFVKHVERLMAYITELRAGQR